MNEELFTVTWTKTEIFDKRKIVFLNHATTL